MEDKQNGIDIREYAEQAAQEISVIQQYGRLIRKEIQQSGSAAVEKIRMDANVFDVENIIHNNDISDLLGQLDDAVISGSGDLSGIMDLLTEKLSSSNNSDHDI